MIFFQFEEYCIRQVVTIILSDLCPLKLFFKKNSKPLKFLVTQALYYLVI